MECLINKVGNEEPKNDKIDLQIMFIIGISSLINYCITMLWSLIAIDVQLRIPFQILLSLVEVLVSLILGLISDTKGRKVSIKYSFIVILTSGLLSLLLVLGNLLVGSDMLKFDLLYLKGNNVGIKDLKAVVNYDNILIYDDNLSVLGKVNTEEYFNEEEEEENMSVRFLDRKNIKEKYFLSKYLNNNEGFNAAVFTLILFILLGMLRSSSINVYYTTNIFIYELEMKNTEDYVDKYNLCWMKICSYNNCRFLSIFIVRAIFLSLMILFLGNEDLSNKNDAINKSYSYIFSINIIILIALAFYGNYIINNKLNYFKEVRYISDVDNSEINICVSRLVSFIFDKKDRLFVFILIPWWVLHFIQTGNNFNQWISLGENLNNIEWWGLYLLLFESIIMLVISLGLSTFSLLLSPAIIQVCCFVLISTVSSGLTICTYMIREIPIKSFSDFASAFLLCHGIFHLCCVIPSITILFLTIDSVLLKMRSSVLSLIQISILTAPFFDIYLNNHTGTVNISQKFLIITSIVVFGLFFTGLFMNRHLSRSRFNIEYEENSSTNSLELLPIYKEVVDTEKRLINREYRLYTF
ncbi:hypothetical protein RS030_223479 [Cryptosporidium xiaoi]|uniref:Transporter n=1 Tax=Cryptosporidium xiaoi TaxID=659607 RepID=A0AAV9XY44_9CRYT